MGIKQAIKIAIVTAGLASGAVSAEVDEQTVEAIKMLWQNQDKALDAHDVDGVMATFADSDDIMLMGTGPGEHWVGKEEIKDAYMHFMEGFEANTLATQCGEGHGSSRGDVVWVTAVCTYTSAQQKDAPGLVMNLSAVVVKQGDDWRFHTMHFSHLTGNPDQASE